MGSSIKQPSEIEKENMKGMRRSIVAKKYIKKGEFIYIDSITFKRPSAGLDPKFFDDIVGKKALRDLPVDEFIQWDDVTIQND